MEQNMQPRGKAENPLQHSQIVKTFNVYSKLSSYSSIIEIQQPRISEELIIIKDEGQKALINSIICPICLLTLPLPYYECQQCNNSFCPSCIEDWWNKHPEKSCIFKCQKATFKKVKRSNTYGALMDVLQFKCGLCVNSYPLSSYEKHNMLECSEADIQCSHVDCKTVIKRKNIVQHEKECEYRFQRCQFCNKQVLFKDLNIHEQKLCPQRTILCENKDCGKSMKLEQVQSHREVCQFKIQNCKWCKELYRRFELLQHERNCQCRTIVCQWCEQHFKPSEFYLHNCQLRQQTCKLCLKPVLIVEMRQHRQECMFDSMIKLRQQNEVLLEQNRKLHYKITQLQELIEDAISNSDLKALKAMQGFKLKQKQQLQKDMQRINNSMSSVNRLRDEEIGKHLDKIKHIFGTSLCIQCKNLERKFMEMKEPLIKKRREIQQRIDEICNVYETPRGDL